MGKKTDLSITDELTFLNEYEHIMLSRILIARKENTKAAQLLKRLLTSADKGGRVGSLIEILILLAISYSYQQDLSSAMSVLERALKLAQPEGYLRIFADEGDYLSVLLKEASIRGICPEYISVILEAINTPMDQNKTSSDQPLIEPLSRRELEVLELIMQGLSNREICDKLFIALDTVKGHNTRIYGKLGVKTRIMAIKEAGSLHLFNSET